jgi:hypothetical protein
MEKVSTPVDRHCRSKRTTKRTPAQTENLANRLPYVKKQQMRWTPRGADLLLQVRTQVLNDDLRPTFERWSPSLKPNLDSTWDAAA